MRDGHVIDSLVASTLAETCIKASSRVFCTFDRHERRQRGCSDTSGGASIPTINPTVLRGDSCVLDQIRIDDFLPVADQHGWADAAMLVP